MIVNFTNHPSTDWSAEQTAAAKRWGTVVDLPFPAVSAVAGENDIAELAETYCARICGLIPDAVLVQGEMSLAFAVAERLRRSGIRTLCAASERVCETAVAEEGSTIRRSVFKFVRFREYR
ncbi:MAG: hypothetical protein NC401_18220 [Ruminococcus sp.]|nr:hypothetical protein [Ruminococcus sp.]